MIKAKRCLYIKLGAKGEFEEDCIETSNTIRLDYKEYNHKDCISGQWSKVLGECRQHSKTETAAKNHLNQLKLFYESDKDTLWYTFYKGKMYWTFASDRIILHPDGKGTKIRKCKRAWSSKDLNGDDLVMSSLSGKLTRTKGYRMTLAESKIPTYILQRINGISPPKNMAARKAFSQLETTVANLVSELTETDFELLVELVFTNTGWKRVGAAGGQEKDIDLELVSPMTNERCAVQVKSETNQSQLLSYIAKISPWGLERLFYVYHTCKGTLTIPPESKNVVTLVDDRHLAKRIIRAGLTEWLIDRTA